MKSQHVDFVLVALLNPRHNISCYSCMFPVILLNPSGCITSVSPSLLYMICRSREALVLNVHATLCHVRTPRCHPKTLRRLLRTSTTEDTPLWSCCPGHGRLTWHRFKRVRKWREFICQGVLLSVCPPGNTSEGVNRVYSNLATQGRGYYKPRSRCTPGKAGMGGHELLNTSDVSPVSYFCWVL